MSSPTTAHSDCILSYLVNFLSKRLLVYFVAEIMLYIILLTDSSGCLGPCAVIYAHTHVAQGFWIANSPRAYFFPNTGEEASPLCSLLPTSKGSIEAVIDLDRGKTEFWSCILRTSRSYKLRLYVSLPYGLFEASGGNVS